MHLSFYQTKRAHLVGDCFRWIIVFFLFVSPSLNRLLTPYSGSFSAVTAVSCLRNSMEANFFLGSEGVSSMLHQSLQLEEESDDSKNSSSCDSQRYRSTCLSLPHCYWCCDGIVGHQCMDASKNLTSGFSRCGANARIDSAKETCESRCLNAKKNCSECEAMSWCFFCLSSNLYNRTSSRSAFPSVDAIEGQCTSATSTCNDSLTIQTCLSAVESDPPHLLVLTYNVVATIATILFSFLAFGALVWVALWAYRRRQLFLSYLRRVQESFSIQYADIAPLLQSEDEEPSVTQVPPINSRNQEAIQGISRINAKPQNTKFLRSIAPEKVRMPTRGVQLPPESDRSKGQINRSTEREAQKLFPKLPGDLQNDTQCSREEEESLRAVLPILDHLDLCCLCLEAPAAVTFLPCHHTCCCENCSNSLHPSTTSGSSAETHQSSRKKRFVACPLCRAPIEAMVSLPEIFVTSSSSAHHLVAESS